MDYRVKMAGPEVKREKRPICKDPPKPLDFSKNKEMVGKCRESGCKSPPKVNEGVSLLGFTENQGRELVIQY